MKSGSLNLLETSGPVQPCTGIALPLPLLFLCCVFVLFLRCVLCCVFCVLFVYRVLYLVVYCFVYRVVYLDVYRVVYLVVYCFVYRFIDVYSDF
jgi:hypothetical protein